VPIIAADQPLDIIAKQGQWSYNDEGSAYRDEPLAVAG